MMSATGVCPHCGKTFKRLNSHLPHCKAKVLSDSSQSQQDATLAAASNDTLSTPPPSRPTMFSSAKPRKSVIPSKESLMKTKKDKESRLPSLPQSESLPPSTPPNGGSESLAPPAYVSRPTPPRRTPPRLAGPTSSSSVAPSALLISPPELANPATRAGKQRTSQHTTNGPLKPEFKPAPASSDPIPAAPRPAPDPLCRPTREHGAGTKLASSLAPEEEPEVPSKTETSSRCQTSGLPADRVPPGGVLGAAETPGRSLDAGGVQCVRGAHASTTLGNARDVLGRSKVNAGQVKPGPLATHHLIQPSPPPRNRPPVDSECGGVACVQTPFRHADGTGPLFTSTSQSTQSACRDPPVTEPRASPPHEEEGFSPATAHYPSAPPAPAPHQGPALPASLARAAAQVGSSSLNPPSSSSPVPCPLTNGEHRITTRDPEVDLRNMKLIKALEGHLAGRRLGQVRLGELPLWLALHAPSRPGAALDALWRGWRWYRRRYIDVKRGGLGGLAMLLAGYCVLGYAWTYPQRKSDRWRKFH